MEFTAQAQPNQLVLFEDRERVSGSSSISCYLDGNILPWDLVEYKVLEAVDLDISRSRNTYYFTALRADEAMAKIRVSYNEQFVDVIITVFLIKSFENQWIEHGDNGLYSPKKVAIGGVPEEYDFQVYGTSNFLGQVDFNKLYIRDKAMINLSDGYLKVGSKNVISIERVPTTEVNWPEDVYSDVDVGAIEQGFLIPKDISLKEFADMLLKKTYYPTFTEPSASLTSNQPNQVEAGYIGDLILTMNFDRGSINGLVVGGVWDSNEFQDYRSGAANEYMIEGINTLLVNNRTISNHQFIDNANSFSASVSYDEGLQPLDSLGENYLDPLPFDTINKGLTINGRRKLFYGVDSSSDAVYTLSNEIRALSNNILNPQNGTNFIINIPIGAKKVVFAYPSTLRDVDSVIYVEGLNAEIKNVFNKTEINVEGMNGFNPIAYKVYTYIPAEPFPDTATYNVTI